MNRFFELTFRTALGLGLCAFTAGLQAQISATELDRLIAGDALQGDQMGWSVDVDGNRAVLGAPFEDIDSGNLSAGAAYVFLRNAQVADQSGPARRGFRRSHLHAGGIP